MDELKGAPPEASGDGAPAAVCPRLGFADDPARHYSRPTALHRCFASPAPSVVSNYEQLELCLSGAFSTCPRFGGGQNGPATPAPAGETPPPQLVDEPTRLGGPRPPLGERTLLRGPTRQALEEHTLLAGRRRPLVLIVCGAFGGLLLAGIAFGLVMPALSRPPEPVATQALAVRPTVVLPPRPTALPTPRPTSTTVPRAPSPTAAPRPTVLAGGPSLLDARFTSGPADNWVENPPYAAWSDGAYRLQARDLAQFVAVGVPTGQDLSDTVVSATFRKTGGSPGGGYGLILRDQGPLPRDGISQESNAYVFATGDLGEFGVWRRDGDHWVDLVPWTRSNAVRAGGSPNDLMVRALGVQMTFNVNGMQVAVVEDDTLASGGVGIFVGGDYNEVALDHFSVQLPD